MRKAISAVAPQDASRFEKLATAAGEDGEEPQVIEDAEVVEESAKPGRRKKDAAL